MHAYVESGNLKQLSMGADIPLAKKVKFVRTAGTLLLILCLLSSVAAADNARSTGHHHFHSQPPGPIEIHIKHVPPLETKGPFTFDRHRVTAIYPYTDPDNPNAPNTVEVNISYPQILSTSVRENIDVADWNIIHHRNAPNGADNCDSTEDYKVGYVTKGFISLEITHSQMCRGAAHPWGDTRMDNRLIKDHRQLAPCDIFDNAKPWQEALHKFALKRLEEDNRRYDLSRLSTFGWNPSGWGFDPKGLVIQFTTGDLGGYAQGAPRLVIPWEYVKPYLSSHRAVQLPFEEQGSSSP